MNIETYKPLSQAPEGKNLIPFTKTEKPQDGKLVMNYTNSDGSPFLTITRDPSQPDQQPRVYLQPDTPLDTGFVIKGKADEIAIFGQAPEAKTPKTVTIEGTTNKLEAVGDLFVSVTGAEHVFASGSRVEIETDVDSAAAQDDAVIHGRGMIGRRNFDSSSYIYSDR